ncbi:ParA family protein [Hyalangium rubrum]|uniref:AAA family ATPase n=1 Tax=Hyalangium rubrum TaxID=3103134 RepID=A0ABU5HGC9_9BACT|nr:AAA family ATPase [Hyalangium sp. s54d21]MDY7232503.1 AAA family ATPase [Hyalangium sp. s54d21]
MPVSSICFFNNKGGVGKTTLACNVASYIAQQKNRKVLVVDADPQCNATQLVLPEGITVPLYSQGIAGINSLRDVLSPISAGDASLVPPFVPAPPETNRFGISILPGHPSVALLEDKLSQSWTEFVGGGLGGARVSNWNTQFLQHVSSQYDIIIYDVGPSLGALNRSVLIGVDFFVAPMGCDIFSLIGIDNIANWIERWHRQYDQSYSMTLENEKENLLKYQVKTSSAKMSRFLGYTVQQYITKTIRAERRPTAAYEAIMQEIPKRIENKLGSVTAKPLSSERLRLGDVPHMFSLVPLAQTAHAPIYGLTRNDGLSGGQFSQHEEYKTFIAQLSDSLLHNLTDAQGVSA